MEPETLNNQNNLEKEQNQKLSHFLILNYKATIIKTVWYCIERDT